MLVDVTVQLDKTQRLLRQLLAARSSMNGGAIIDHEAPRERWFAAVEK